MKILVVWLGIACGLLAGVSRIWAGEFATDVEIDKARVQTVKLLLATAGAPGGFEAGQNDAAWAGGRTALAARALRCDLDLPYEPYREDIDLDFGDLMPVLEWVKDHPSPSVGVAAWRVQVRTLGEKSREVVHDECEVLAGALAKLEADKRFAGPKPEALELTQVIPIVDALGSASPQYELPLRTWQFVDRQLRQTQTATGAWQENGKETDLAVALGTLGLMSAEEMLEPGMQVKGKVDKKLDLALARFRERIGKLAENPTASDLDTLYFAQRVCAKTGSDLLYSRRFAAKLLALRQADGSWPVAKLGVFGPSPSCVTTSLALMMLTETRVRVPFARLDLGTSGRSQDVGALTDRVSRWLCGMPMRWRNISLNADLESWRYAPILVISAGSDPHFTPEQIQRLGDYIRMGGMVLSNGEGQEVAKAMQQAATVAVGNRYEMRELPAEHPVFTEWSNGMKDPPRVSGLSNGVREVWVHVHRDFSADWQRRRVAKTDAWELPMNVYWYVARGSFGSDPMEVGIGEGVAGAKTLNVARVRYEGNWDPEPGAWERFGRVTRGQGFEIKTTEVGAEGLDPTKTPVAHLTGTGAAKLSEGEVKALRAFVVAGGVLLVDTAGGNVEGQKALRVSLAGVLPRRLLGAVAVGRRDLRRALQLDESVPGEGIFNMPDGKGRIVYFQGDMTGSLLGSGAANIVGGRVEKAREIVLGVVGPLAK